MPLTRNLDRKKYKMMMGTAMKIEPAAKRANSVSPRFIRPTATVYRSFCFRSSLGRMKSLQGQTNWESSVYTIIGPDSGRVIFVNTWKLVAPSILAASSIVWGIVSKKPFCVM